MDSRTDPVILDLLRWLKDSLPPDIDEESLFRKVRKVQKIFDTLIGLTFEEFYNNASQQNESLENQVNDRLRDMKNYLTLDCEKHIKTNKLNQSRQKLDIKKQQYQVITSIRLNSCLDLISRYNHLMSKK